MSFVHRDKKIGFGLAILTKLDSKIATFFHYLRNGTLSNAWLDRK